MLEVYSNYNEIEKEAEKKKFQNTIKLLLNKTYVYSDKKALRYIAKNSEAFQNALEPLGYLLVVDSTLGYVGIKDADRVNSTNAKRIRLTPNQSVLMALLFAHWSENQSKALKDVVITHEELNSYIETVGLYKKCKTKAELGRDLKALVNHLSSHDIVALKEDTKAIWEEEGELVIYPTISMTIDINLVLEKMQEIVAAQKRVNEKEEMSKWEEN